jgi:NTP pyrophosphatase (non-canonical NTP hydrolase)
MNTMKCDCLNRCGDDPGIHKGIVEPCRDFKRSALYNRNTRQQEILSWACKTFGESIATDPGERIRRFIEEALELSQAAGIDKAAIIELVDYVFSRPAGDPKKEIGQVGITLLAYAQLIGISADTAEFEEAIRITEKDPAYFQDRQNAKANVGIGMKCNLKSG